MAEQMYKIKQSTLEGFAEQTRRLAEVESKMRPLDMIQCLEGIVPGSGGGDIPNSFGVTFGSENGNYVVREPSYIVNGSDINEIASITQNMAGKKVLLTIPEIISCLKQVTFIPKGTATAILDLNLSVSTGGWLPNVPKGNATNHVTFTFGTTSTGLILEG